LPEWWTLFRGNFRRMADRAKSSDDANHAELRAFDPDLWGASPNWDAGLEHSVYDDRELDEELVPLARSVMPGDTSSD
jgi:hypothetical protein